MTNLDKLEYPRHVHKPSIPGDWVCRVVSNPEACADALEQGWSLAPILIDPSAPAPVESSEMSSPPDPPAAAVDPMSVLVARGRGRPRKA